MEQEICKVCGLPITDLMRHLACTALEKVQRDNEIDTKDIRLTSSSMQTPNWRERVQKLESVSQRQAYYDLCEQVEKESIERAIEVVKGKKKSCPHDSRSHCMEEMCWIHEEGGYNQAIEESSEALKTLLH